VRLPVTWVSVQPGFGGALHATETLASSLCPVSRIVAVLTCVPSSSSHENVSRGTRKAKRLGRDTPLGEVIRAKLTGFRVRKALVISLLAIAVLAGSAAAALHRYDASRSGQIVDGTTIAGVDVGGMSAAEARATVDREVARRLEQPLTLDYRNRRFATIDPALVKVRANVDELVAAAMAESREGNFLTRSWRELTGGEAAVEHELEVAFSSAAVRRVVTGVRRELDSPVREAKVSASFDGVHISSSSVGVSVKEGALRRAIAKSLVSADAARTVTVPTREIEPKVTTKELADRYSHFIAISRSRRELRLFVNQKLVKSYRVGIGAAGFETPAGIYEIESKAVNPAWYVPNKAWAGDLAGKVIPGDDPDNPIKARWMGFWNGAGIHGTADEASIGTAASHGCIRMLIREVIDLYDRVPLHAPLSIS
jgi:lipoprotein-anchoring transpeptidase ErfK/SrfK